LDLARDVKDNKKAFSTYISNKRKTRENVGPLLSKTGDWVTQGVEGAEVLNAAFVSVFISKAGLQESQVPATMGKSLEQGRVPLVEEDRIREYLRKFDTRKSVGPDGMHPQVLTLSLIRSSKTSC